MARILLAEDNREVSVLVQRVLAQDGYEIEPVDNGQTAIEKIATEHFDAILLDFMMPLASGFDVITWIEENRPELGQSCVIVLTAAVHELKTFDASKVYATVAKPFDVFALRETVRRCIEEKAADGQG